MIGYGGMLMESFVAIMALICAAVLDPGVYFAINSPAALLGTSVDTAAEAVRNLGFVVTPEALTLLAQEVGENSILSRTGGAPTFAIGMAHIITEIFNSREMMAFWYHFAILFEALFILTTVDAGTRVCRFMIQDLLGTFVPVMKRTDSWMANVVATALAVTAWGYFLYQGVVDPLGGINTLWPLFGISNQMLAAIALILCTVVLFKMKRQRYAWVTMVPTAWLLICTLTAGWQKLFHPNPAIGFLSHAGKFSDALAAGTVLAPAKTVEEMNRIIFNDYVDAVLCGLFIAVVLSMVVYGVLAIRKALANPNVTTREVGGDEGIGLASRGARHA